MTTRGLALALAIALIAPAVLMILRSWWRGRADDGTAPARRGREALFATAPLAALVALVVLVAVADG